MDQEVNHPLIEERQRDIRARLTEVETSHKNGIR